MRSLLFNYLNILLFALFTSAITAQPSEDGPITDLGTISNDGNAQPNNYHFCLDDDNQLIIKIKINIDNLPSGTYPEMYVEFDVDGQTNVVPVGDLETETFENGQSGFSYTVESLPFDFSQACTESEEEFISVYISYRLVMQQSDDNYITYPACDYTNSMFTCAAYPIAPWCDAVPINGFGAAIPGDDPTAVCYDEWFSGGYAASLYCDCEDDTPLPPKHEVEGGDMFDGGVIIDTRVDKENKINVYPNPMGEIMNIESNNESIRQIEIYNSNGELVLNNVYNSTKNQKISLNTAELMKGLYLVRITSNSGIKVVKVLK